MDYECMEATRPAHLVFKIASPFPSDSGSVEFVKSRDIFSVTTDTVVPLYKQSRCFHFWQSLKRPSPAFMPNLLFRDIDDSLDDGWIPGGRSREAWHDAVTYLGIHGLLPGLTFLSAMSCTRSLAAVTLA